MINRETTQEGEDSLPPKSVVHFETVLALGKSESDVTYTESMSNDTSVIRVLLFANPMIPLSHVSDIRMIEHEFFH